MHYLAIGLQELGQSEVYYGPPFYSIIDWLPKQRAK